VAGNHFTNDIAVGLGIPPAAAEQVKIEHGSAITDFVDPRETIDVPMGLGRYTQPVSRLTLNQLIRDRAIELVRMILGKVAESGLKKVPPGGIVLTGGTANLTGLTEIAADYGKCAVRVGSPSASLGLPAELERSAFATGVGLILWSIQHKHPGGVALTVTVNDGVLSKLKGWFGKFASRTPVPPSGATGVRA
jgi:cell division protein FtsA